jgi:hypothetical protein
MYLARRVKGHRIRVYPLRPTATTPDFSAAQFNPPDCALTRSELSGPGCVAVGETRCDAKYQLLRIEELLNG